MEHILREFQSSEITGFLAKKIYTMTNEEFKFMEVCGTHTMVISAFGIRSLIPQYLKLISGPGCPVCVTPMEDIDRVIEIGRRNKIILTTFGDMMRVPGSNGNLEDIRIEGKDIRVVYSTRDALKIAIENSKTEVVFIGVGFETTSPTVAVTILEASRRKIKNFSVISLFKLIPPALRSILKSERVKIDGFILPGHVSAIIGAIPYEFIAKEFGKPCVISGFEPVDIMESIIMLLEQIKRKTPMVEIGYKRIVKREGNSHAMNILNEVFEPSHSNWRALGEIPESGLKFKENYKEFDASIRFPVEVVSVREQEGCICGEILMGLALPSDCSLFGTICTPFDAVGPCMVSSEGACAALYKYR